MADNPSDLVGKEFIFEYGLDRIMPPSEKTRGVFATEQRAYRRERVTRCRDCVHYWEEDPWGNRDACSQGVMYTPHPRLVRPDGFCAWGVPREVEK